MELGKKIHFIGIGGIGMSGLARLYLHEGMIVSGSDSTKTANTEKLETEGAVVTYTQIAGNIQDDIHMVVYTEAMPVDHPELLAAREKGLKTINYFEALSEVANKYYLIAVAGTHGKTTTTAMLIDILEEGSFDPTAIVGSLRSKTGSNFRAGKSKYFIVEACEYRRDFLTLEPDVLVITNLEHEHVDYYKDLASVQGAFMELAIKVPEDGAIITDVKNQNISPILEGTRAKIVNYTESFDPLLKLTQPGVHNQMNAAAAKATAAFLGIEQKYIIQALEHFIGTKRRFEYMGTINDAPVYDDYAHHPTEITASIEGARELYPNKKITVVFQPHTYSRTRELFEDFVRSLSAADRIILAPIYAARKEEGNEVPSKQLAESISKSHTRIESVDSLDAIVKQLRDSANDKDVVLIMGAGDVTKVAAGLIS